MSLIKQLWIGICLILMLALGGSFFISTLAARQYLEQQLHLKNIDNATSLALSMTQMEKDPVTLELLLAAQFDSGHYQRIRLLDPQGEVIAERQYHSRDEKHIPEWFDRFLSIDTQPGIAQIQDGWQQYGSLEVLSHSRYAKEELWASTKRLLQWLLLAALLSGLVGTIILKMITRPLGHVVRQAESIGQRHFVTSKEPRTREFRKLVRAMNTLSASVKSMLEKETQKLEKLRTASQQDDLTGLSNREHFLNLLDSVITREDSEQEVAVYLVRVLNLVELNQRFGRDKVDELLLGIAHALRSHLSRPEEFSGRLNGTDFALVSFGEQTLNEGSQLLREHLEQQLSSLVADPLQIGLPMAASDLQPRESRGQLLSRLDGLLARSEQRGNRGIMVHNVDRPGGAQRNLNDWRISITQSLADSGVDLGCYAVRAGSGSLIHWERPVRLFIDGIWQNAGFFVGWARRLGVLAEIDWQVVRFAINDIREHERDSAVNISESALCDLEFRTRVLDLLKYHPVEAARLWLEFPETCAVRQMPQLKQFSTQLRELGCKVGLEHVGLEFTQIRELEGIGLDYLKIDSAIIRQADKNTANHSFIQSLCAIGHSLGIVMIAEGVLNEPERQALDALNVDGYTGPGIE